MAFSRETGTPEDLEDRTEPLRCNRQIWRRRPACRWSLEFAGLAGYLLRRVAPLCILEILVHATTSVERSDPRVWFEITLPPEEVLHAQLHRLPAGWNNPMRLHPATVGIGDKWLRTGQRLALRVPSAIVPGSWNYLLNPLHSAFRFARWTKPAPLDLDDRLISGMQS